VEKLKKMGPKKSTEKILARAEQDENQLLN
jgi:hypothetical protein